MDKNNFYNDSSIQQQKGAARIRQRPASMLGSDGLDGAKHTITEIIGNSLDEANSGFGDTIEVEYFEDGSLSIRDYGRGIPLGWNSAEQQWNYYLIFEELYAGGKYVDNDAKIRKVKDWTNFKMSDIPYLFTVGLNGLGAAASQMSSEFFKVISYRDGQASEMNFEKGVSIQDELKVYPTNEKNGTFIHWKPDNEVFSDVDFGVKWLRDYVKKFSHFTGVTFVLKYGVEVETEEGLIYEEKVEHFQGQTIAEYAENQLDGFTYGESFYSEETVKGKMGVCLTKAAVGVSGLGMQFFHNSVPVKAGVHSSAVMSALGTFFKGIKLKTSVKPSDYVNKFSVLISSFSNIMSYRGQTKDSIDDEFIEKGIEKELTSLLTMAYTNKEKWLLALVKEVEKEAETRKKIEQEAEKIKKATKVTKAKRVPEKFTSCADYEEGNAENVELFLLEGDSAAAAFLSGRDPKTQCYYPTKGKSLNVYKASLTKMVSNSEIQDIITLLGSGVEVEFKDESLFDINNLKVGKVVFLADADIDGLHIKMLLFVIFYKLFPELLYEGKVWVSKAPLYKGTMKDGSLRFYFTQKEYQEDLPQIKKITRFKGLGEMDAKDMHNTLLNPETRKMDQLIIDREDTSIPYVLDVLFNEDTSKRKEIILRDVFEEGYSTFEEELNAIKSKVEEIELTSKGFEEVEL